ncbi:ankyrin repeat domain-containing protein [Acerihabitans sp.]|uniref:ankyrin repeat domain-containing protein n=1 Tax=Acerihabitans sp. TaxID=2811394 RepID=UPI002ED944EE
MFCSAIAAQLETQDLSQCYFKIRLAMETMNVKIKFVEGLYWVEQKSNGKQFPLDLAVLRKEHIVDKLDVNMIKFAICNSTIDHIETYFTPSWFQQSSDMFYEIDHPAIFAVALLCVSNNILSANKAYRHGRTVLMAAVIIRNKEAINSLMKRTDVDINCKDEFGMTALVLAVKYGTTAQVSSLLKSNLINVNIQDCDGNTALFHAIIGGKKYKMKHLINDGRNDINLINNKGHSVLYLSILHDFPTVESIVKHNNIDINSRDGCYNPLCKAIIEKRLDIVKLFLTSPDLDVNRCNAKGRTALHIAVAMRNEAIVRALLQKRLIDINIMDKNGITPMMMASIPGNENIMAIFLAESV